MMAPEPRTHFAPARTRRPRGVAMIMVIIAMVITTVLTAALLTAPDTSRPIAQNAIDAAEARWSAESASNFTTAAIEKKVAAETVGGVFLNDYAIAGGDADVVVTNADGEVPTPDDREIIVTTNATSGGMHRTVQRRLTLNKPFDPAIGIDMRYGEAAVLVNGSMDVRGMNVANWGRSPEARGGTARVVVQVDRVPDIRISDLSVAGAIGMSALTGTAVRTVMKTMEATSTAEIPLKMPTASTPAPDISGATAHLQTLGLPLAVPLLSHYRDLALRTGQDTTLATGRYGDLSGQAGWTARLTTGLYVFENLNVTEGSQLLIEGDATIVVLDAAQIAEGARVSIGETGSARLYLHGKMSVEGADITPWVIKEEDVVAKIKSIDAYASPARFLVDVAPGGRILLSNDALVHADIHAPEGIVSIEESAVIGRLTADALVADSAYVLYDPVLDTRTGFFAEKSPLYDADGVPIAGVEAVIDAFENALPDITSVALRDHVVAHWDIEGWRATAKESGYSSVEMKKVAISAYGVERSGIELGKLKLISLRTGTPFDDVLGATLSLVEVPE